MVYDGPLQVHDREGGLHRYRRDSSCFRSFCPQVAHKEKSRVVDRNKSGTLCLRPTQHPSNGPMGMHVEPARLPPRRSHGPSRAKRPCQRRTALGRRWRPSAGRSAHRASGPAGSDVAARTAGSGGVARRPYRARRHLDGRAGTTRHLGAGRAGTARAWLSQRAWPARGGTGPERGGAGARIARARCAVGDGGGGEGRARRGGRGGGRAARARLHGHAPAGTVRAGRPVQLHPGPHRTRIGSKDRSGSRCRRAGGGGNGCAVRGRALPLAGRCRRGTAPPSRSARAGAPSLGVGAGACARPSAGPMAGGARAGERVVR